jgi:hypothetical protein
MPRASHAGAEPPVTAFDKDGIRILIHTASNPPSADTTALMLTYMNQNAAPVPQFEFLAAVPKVGSEALAHIFGFVSMRRSEGHGRETGSIGLKRDCVLLARMAILRR